MNNSELIRDYIAKNYDNLYKLSKHLKNYTRNTTKDADEVLHIALEYVMVGNETKNLTRIDEHIMYNYVAVLMKWCYAGKRSIWESQYSCSDALNKQVCAFTYEVIDEIDEDYINPMEIVDKTVKKMDKYDKQLYKLIAKGRSIRSISRRTGINYSCMIRDVKKIKENLKIALNGYGIYHNLTKNNIKVYGEEDK